MQTDQSLNQSIASEGVIPKDTIKITISDWLSSMTEGREESPQLDPIQTAGSCCRSKNCTADRPEGPAANLNWVTVQVV